MSDDEPTVSTDDCSNCPACVRQKKRADAVVERFCEADAKAEKLYSAYENNRKHIEAQIQKIKVAERIMRKFELNMKANEEDMATLKATVQKIYDDMDTQGLSYQPEKKESSLANLTLPAPPGT